MGKSCVVVTEDSWEWRSGCSCSLRKLGRGIIDWQGSQKAGGWNSAPLETWKMCREGKEGQDHRAALRIHVMFRPAASSWQQSEPGSTSVPGGSFDKPEISEVFFFGQQRAKLLWCQEIVYFSSCTRSSVCGGHRGGFHPHSEGRNAVLVTSPAPPTKTAARTLGAAFAFKGRRKWKTDNYFKNWTCDSFRRHVFFPV